MKATEFINLMRQVIREEVRSIVKEELKPLKIMVENKHVTVAQKEAPRKTVIKQQAPVQKKQLPPAFDKVSGPLADILRETYMSMQNEPMVEDPEMEWPDMTPTMTSRHVPQSAPMQSITPQANIQAALTGDPTAGFVKDYSHLLKKADAIANNSRG